MDSSLLSSRQKAALTYRKRADSEIDKCITNQTLFGFRKIVGNAEWDKGLRQVIVQCKCGKLETVKYAWLKQKVSLGKMRQCWECGRQSISGANHPNFSGGGRRGVGVDSATNKYKRDHPNCELCGSNENIHVDHKEPISRRPDIAASPDNFQSLCVPCHAKKTGEDGMHHVVAMLLSAVKSTAILINCLHCNEPMLTHPARKHPAKFCSTKCHWTFKRETAKNYIDKMTVDYLAGGISILEISKKYAISTFKARQALIVSCGNQVISKIGIENRSAAKKTAQARSSARKQSTGRSKKLDAKKVQHIKLLLLDGNRHSQIADSFNVSAAAVSHIASGRNWSWVTV